MMISEGDSQNRQTFHVAVLRVGQNQVALTQLDPSCCAYEAQTCPNPNPSQIALSQVFKNLWKLERVSLSHTQVSGDVAIFAVDSTRAALKSSNVLLAWSSELPP